VLPGAGLGDDARLPHAPGEQRLAERVVDLVRAGMGQVLALEVDRRPPAAPGVKDAARMRAFAAAVRAADTEGRTTA